MSASFYKVLSPADWARLQAYLIEEAYGFDYQATLVALQKALSHCFWYDNESKQRYRAKISALKRKYNAVWLLSRISCVNIETGEVYQPTKWFFLQGDIESVFTKASDNEKKAIASVSQISLF